MDDAFFTTAACTGFFRDIFRVERETARCDCDVSTPALKQETSCPHRTDFVFPLLASPDIILDDQTDLELEMRRIGEHERQSSA